MGLEVCQNSLHAVKLIDRRIKKQPFNVGVRSGLGV